MPKLSNESLEKRFPCCYCGGNFRTRQGLSGLIQFKHLAPYTSEQKTEDIDMKFINSKLKELILWKSTSQLPQATIQARLEWIANWHHVRYLCSILDMELTKQDFKNYILIGFGKILELQ